MGGGIPIVPKKILTYLNENKNLIHLNTPLFEWSIYMQIFFKARGGCWFRGIIIEFAGEGGPSRRHIFGNLKM